MGKINKQNRPNATQNQSGKDQKPNEEAKEVDQTKDSKKEEKDAKNSNTEIGLKAYIHCEGCANKIFRCLKGFDGVEEIKINSENNKVVVKGKNADPIKVLNRLRKKYSQNVELLYPTPKPEDKNKNESTKKKDNEPQVKILILKMYIHCEGCAHDIKKSIGRMEGVFTVEPDMNKSRVMVKGVFDPPKLVEIITRRLGKHVEIVKQEQVKSENDSKGNTCTKENKEENVVVYYPQHYSKYLYECHQLFSDENVQSCFVM